MQLLCESASVQTFSEQLKAQNTLCISKIL